MRILEAARSVFAERGFDAAPVDEVARRARVSKGTVYNHFSSKESLLVEAVLQAMSEGRLQVGRLAAADRKSNSALVDHLRRLFVEIFPTISGQAQSLSYQIWALVARDEAVRKRIFSEFHNAYRASEEQFTHTLEEGQAAGTFRSDLDANEVTLVLLAVFDGLVYRAMFDPERVNAELVLDTILNLLETGLCQSGSTLSRGAGGHS
ncbi:MAG: TetR/AcrR family transcriptional regulator [bacterium]|nr:TetR/AcrR family transcriptional regulator [bacterium]